MTISISALSRVPGTQGGFMLNVEWSGGGEWTGQMKLTGHEGGVDLLYV